jgi:transcriptional regulator with XRE-family HTH domain
MTEGPYPNHLARFMRAKGLTDPDLARPLEITKQQIFNLRKGHRKLTVEWARRLAPHLGVSWQELITGAPAPPDDPNLATILASYAVLDERKRETLALVAQGLLPLGPPAEPPAKPRPLPKERSPPSRSIGGGADTKKKRTVSAAG